MKKRRFVRGEVYFLFTLKKPSIDFHLSSNKSLSNATRNIICSKGRYSLMRDLKSLFFFFLLHSLKGKERERKKES